MPTLARSLMVAAVALAAAPAMAVTYDFSVTTAPGVSNAFPTFDFQLPDQPAQVIDLGYGFTIDNVATTGTSQFGSVSYTADYSFYTGAGLNAGFDDGTAYHSYYSMQLFAGPTSAPTFETGSFSLYDDPAGPAVATLVIRQAGSPGAVPEPVSWAMVVVGFGLVGAVSRRRRTGGAFGAGELR